MANATPTRLGQNLATGDANALFLKIFSGEVLSAFGRENQMMNMTTVRNIQQGKSAVFLSQEKLLLIIILQETR